MAKSPGGEPGLFSEKAETAVTAFGTAKSCDPTRRSPAYPGLSFVVGGKTPYKVVGGIVWIGVNLAGFFQNESRPFERGDNIALLQVAVAAIGERGIGVFGARC